MKKLCCLFLCLALLAGLLPGCAKETGEEEYVPTGDARWIFLPP